MKDLKSRFEQYVNKANSSCWEWSGKLMHKGYGVFSIKNKYYRAHRISYKIYNGEIPIGMMVCHSCDNRKCVNPQHLWLGSAKDNTQDAIAKGKHVSVVGIAQPQVGEQNRNSKLLAKEVSEIRAKAAGGSSLRELAANYSVSYKNVVAIVSRRSWKHI